MEKDLLNKNVEVLVSFARGSSSGAISPVLYIGTFLDYDDNYYKIKATNSKVSYIGGTGFVIKESPNKINDEGIIYLRKEFVIYIKEA